MTEYLNSKQAAAYLGVEPETLYSYIRQGRLKAYKLGGSDTPNTKRHWRFLVGDLNAFAAYSVSQWYKEEMLK